MSLRDCHDESETLILINEAPGQEEVWILQAKDGSRKGTPAPQRNFILAFSRALLSPVIGENGNIWFIGVTPWEIY